MNLLPGFQPVEERSDYKQLHRLLWRPPTSLLAASAAREPAALAEYVDVWTDGGGNGEGGVDAMDVGEDESEPPPRPGPPPIRFIDLDKHPELRVHNLLEPYPPTVVVRGEYVEFMAHALQVEKADERRFYLTGQPGIGKSVGACYFLFWLLASGQSVFFIPATDAVYYFSEAGVQQAIDGNVERDSLDVRAAVKRSWVLVDVDVGDSPSAADWYPRRWVKPCAALVWTSSPREERRRRFTDRFLARVWYMSPWSSEEIAAVTKLEKKVPAEIQARFRLSGPVARSLFFKLARASTADIDQVIKKSFTKGLFEFATSQDSPDEESSHRMYLVRPQEKLDVDGVPRLVREEPTFDFLSSYVATRIVELMDQNLDTVRERLVSAFDNPLTRSAAGKLVESMLHRALRRGLVAPFGVGGRRLSELALIGKAADFILEAHVALPPPPLYLRPQSQNFAAVDAIVVSDAVLWLIQSSVADWHSTVFKTLIAILVRLEQKGIKVDGVRLVYCLVGTNDQRVGRLVRAATKKLTALQAARQVDRVRELGQRVSVVNRLLKLDVEGYTFSTLTGLTRVPPAPEEEEEDTEVA
ncbi:hypothetical protein DFH07DRAFT_841473 [Mycena maculata]|uniref:Uncharacterized protein n=1 Tax=Mycena maculata TaxID=230809 RepID=A0AAD7MYV0_9AGAR|nr:hypothetical protein DFH07DRAFT_841473 [Mycena maculata]